MKMKLQFLSLLTLAMITFACQTSTDDNPSPGDVSNTLTDGRWKVSYYYDKDKVETGDFSGYTFDFRLDGAFIAYFGSNTTTGTWRTGTDNGSSRLIIDIIGSKPLDDLPDDWIILEKSDNLIKLKDDNDTHLEELHFMRVN
ncbi:MAG TPA: hypothetical protein PKE06_10510 [Flavilitoribacter sp.]|nr:hypothetical protein [Flavilitoribacter sp.]HMQ86012.1 hypothetical protein [Flavilitoribacter sp.]